MKIITYNIRYDNPSDGIDRWQFRCDDLISLLEEQCANIICFQEVLWNQFEFLQQKLATFTAVGVGRDDGPSQGELGPIFFTKNFQCLASGTFWLSDTPHQAGSKLKSSSLPRICTWAKLEDKDVENSTFCVFNTHLDHASGDARRQQTQILLQQIRHIAGLYPSLLTWGFEW